MKTYATSGYCPTATVDFTKGDLNVKFGLYLPSKAYDPTGFPLMFYHNSREANHIGRNHSDLLGTGWSSSVTRAIANYRDDQLDDYPVVVKAGGAAVKYGYDKQSESFITPEGSYNGFEWDGGDLNLARETVNDSFKVDYRNDDTGSETFNARLESEADQNANTTYFNHDAGKLLREIIDPDQRSVTFTYNGNDKMSSVTDWANRTTYLGYDGSGNMNKVIGPEQCVNYLDYDEHHRIKTIIDAEGATRYFDYDSEDRVTRDHLLGAGATRYQYDFGKTWVTDANGHTTQYEYTYPDPEPAVITDALGHTARHEYVDGRRVRTIDANGSEWYFSYDEDTGLRESETDPYNNTAYYLYDALQNMTCEVDKLGEPTYCGYDDNGNRTHVIDALEQTTYYGYDEEGLPEYETDARNHTTYFGHDQYGRRTSVTDPLGHTTYYEYTDSGQTSSETDARGYTRYYEYDLQDRLTKETDPLGYTREYGYDSRGLMTVELDEAGHATYYTTTTSSASRSPRRTRWATPRPARTTEWATS